MAALITFIPLLVLLYFLMIRPQQKRSQAQQAMMRSVGEGDEVMTTGGFYGYVTAVEDDVFWIELAEGVQVRVAKAAIMRRVGPADHDGHKAPGAPDAGDTDAPSDVDEHDEH